ncbi:MAG: TatD family hydrolase [Alphaproteobacteria bacterium]|nr:TatD family hydrolase [Alphaproteobacteria bacterium]
MDFIDTHIHLQDFQKECTEKVITEAINEKVNNFLCVSSKNEEWNEVLNLFQQHPTNIIPALGIHPWSVEKSTKEDLERLESLLQAIPQALIGECGIDGHKPFMAKQISFFLEQCHLAKKYHRPMIIHAVKAQSFFEKNWSELPEKIVFHSYNGKADFLKEICKQEAYVSFSFSILKNKQAKELLQLVPRDRLLLETDSPYQACEKNALNYPKFLPKLVFDVAKILEIDYEDFTKTISQNALEFMKIG